MADKNSQPGEGSGTGQLGTQKNTKRVGTIYGSSLLRNLQTPQRKKLAEQVRQLREQKQHGTPSKNPVQIKMEPNTSQAEQTSTPQMRQQTQRQLVQGQQTPGQLIQGQQTPRQLIQGQLIQEQQTQKQLVQGQQTPGQQVLQSNPKTPVRATGPQLCLKFVKATGPDGKPGLTAILGASPNQQGVAPLQKQTPNKGASPLQTQVQQQAKMQHSGPPQATPSSTAQKNLSVAPIQVPAPVSNTSKSVPAPRDETQQAVDALIASTSDGIETRSTPNEPKIGNWKNKPKAERRVELAKTERLLNALRNLTSQQKAQVKSVTQQLQNTASQQISETNQSRSSPGQPGTSQGVPQSDGTTNLQSQVLGALQLQQSTAATVSPQKSFAEPGTSEQARSPRILGPRKRYPRQVPQDEDPLGLDQRKLQGKKKTRKGFRRVSPEEAARYLESTYERRQPPRSSESTEWENMMKNIDIFMFAVYRCKICPNYYTTVKTTMMGHMSDVHRRSKNRGRTDVANVDGNGDHVEENVQTRVKNIQEIFERKLRSQSGGGGVDFEVNSEHSENSVVDIPFSSASPTDEVNRRAEQNGDVDGGNDDQNRSVGGGCDDDDDDYDVGGGFEDMDDDDDEDRNEDGAEKQEHIEAGGVRKSPRFVKLSSTPMIRKYHHTKKRSISPQINNEREKVNKGKSRSWPHMVLTKTPKENIMKRKRESKKGDSSKKAKSIEEEGMTGGSVDEEGLSKQTWKQTKSYVYDEDEDEIQEEEMQEESSEDEVEDVRDLSEVMPKEPPTLRMKSNGPPPAPRPNKRERKRNKQKHQFQPGNKHYTKRAGFMPAKERKEKEEQIKEIETLLNSEASEDTHTVKLPPIERPKTRSQGVVHVASEQDVIKPASPTVGKRFHISRYQAWELIGLDPNSEPPWPCTHPGCGYYFASLGSVVTHHVWKHDTFGDRNQRMVARALGEKYSLFEKREKRAVDGAKIDDAVAADEETGIVTSRRKKKPVKRLSNVMIGKNDHFIPTTARKKVLKKKTSKCKYCKRLFSTDMFARMHMRAIHKTKWMADNNITQKDLDEITKNVAENGDDTSANISLLATVADKLDDKVNLICKQCSFKAISARVLRTHMDQAHPDYIRSIYSDSEGEDEGKDTAAADDDDGEKQTSAVTPSSRPVRACRRKALLKKEKKLDKIIPLILPHHSIYGQALPEEEAGYDDDDDGEDGGEEKSRSGTSLQCHECNYIAVADKHFVTHMKKIHNQEVVLNYKCAECDFVGTRKQMFFHKKSHVPTIMCDVCGKTVKGEKRLKIHQQFNCSTKEWKRKKKAASFGSKTCPICNREFHNAGTYHYHMACHRSDAEGETYSCDLCERKFTRRHAMTAHRRCAHTEGRHQCEHCPYKTHHKAKLRDHLFERHNIGEEDVPVLKCKFEGCSFTTKKRHQLKSHKRKHNNTRFKFWCDGCNQPIRTLKCLARHQVLHRDGVTKYKCKECGYQATDSNTLSSHKHFKHARGEKTIMCDLCGEAFTRRADLNYHTKAKHTVRLVKCRVCDLTFKFNSQVAKHMKEEHPEQVAAEAAAELEEATKIINAVPKVRVKSTGPRKKRIRKKKPPTGRKVGRPKLPETPELIARREELKRARNKRKYENRKAKMKRLGLKRKKYPKKKGQTSTRTQGRGADTVSTVDSNEQYSDEEVATAAQQLESIAQAFTTQSPYKAAGGTDIPVQVVPTDHDAYRQLTALNQEFINTGASTSSGGNTLHIHPPVTTQEIEIPTTEHQQEGSTTTQRIIPASLTGEASAGGRPGEEPVSYLEVTTVHSDGRRQVEMWPVWQDP